MNCTQNVFFVNNSQKNLNIFLFLYKKSNLFNNFKYLEHLENNNIILHYLNEYNIFIDKSVYYNKDNIVHKLTTNSIRNKLLNSIVSLDKKISYIVYLNSKLWYLNRLTYLNTNLCSNKRLLFTNRLVKEPRTLLSKLHKNVGFVKEDSDYISYWYNPIKHKYDKKKNINLVLFRNNFNRVLVNNLINLFCPGYLHIFFNIFRHFTKLISKRVMLLYLNDYNFFSCFIKKKYNNFTIKWFKKFSTTSDDSTNKLFLTNYIRPTMFRKDLKFNLVTSYRKKQTHMYSWLYMISMQEILKNIDLKLFYIIKYIYLMRGKRYHRIFERSKKLYSGLPVNNKKFMSEAVNVFCISMRTKDPKFIFDFLFKYFNTMHFRMQFRFISFLKGFIKHNFSLFKDFYRIRGLRILIKGKIGKTGSVRKKKILLSFGRAGYANLRLRMDESVGPMFTPTGVIGARIIITY